MPVPRPKAFLLQAGILGALVFGAASAQAQANYRNAPIGGRSQLLGGTGMTYGRDATAAFLNPATAVLVDDRRLSFSVNFYTISLMYAPRWYMAGPIDRSKFGDIHIDNASLSDLSFNALPSSLCIFSRAGDIPYFARWRKDPLTREARIGICFATIQDQSFDFSAEGFSQSRTKSVAHQAQTLSQSYTRFAAGPTYAMHISNSVAIGASLHGSLANHRNLVTASATTYGASPSAINSIFYDASHGDAFQLEATVGATLRFGSQTVGISVKSPSIHIYGVGSVNQQVHYEGSGSATSTLAAQGSFVSRSPLRVGIGTGFEGRWGLFELDATFSAPTTAYSAEMTGYQIESTNDSFGEQKATLNLSSRARGVANFATGVELFMSPRLSLLSGLSTDISAVPSGSLTKGSPFNYYPDRTERIALSMGISSHGEDGELLFGGELSAGWGDRLAVNSYQLPPTIGSTGHGLYQLMLVVAGSTSLRNLKRAVENVKQVIESPTPLQPISPGKPGGGPLYNPREAPR
jgi:hypothetical protein